MGLKKYLEDFSLLAQRNVDETFLWQEYMVYAMMFDIAEQVSEQLEELYPDRISQIQEYQWYMSESYEYDRVLYNGVRLERHRLRGGQTARSDGDGGSASFGGGGGFSGGGGMGTR